MLVYLEEACEERTVYEVSTRSWIGGSGDMEGMADRGDGGARSDEVGGMSGVDERNGGEGGVLSGAAGVGWVELSFKGRWGGGGGLERTFFGWLGAGWTERWRRSFGGGREKLDGVGRRWVL